MADGDGWCTIESDPGVFTELIEKFGVKDVQVEELYDLSDESLGALMPVHGLVFLFKWQAAPEVGEAAAPKYMHDDASLFFAKQVVQNACATQALLAILLNAQGVEMGPVLSNFKEFTTGLDPDTTGLTISNSEEIRAAHNSFSNPGLIHVDDPTAKKDGDAFHFVSYLPAGGHLLELDGLKPAPIDHGDVAEGSSWISMVRPVIEARMQQYASSEVRFNLMAIVADRRKEYQGALSEATALLDTELSADASAECHAKIADLRSRIEEEDAKHARWKAENVRRKHNFMPLCMEMLKALAKAGKLGDAVKAAKERATAEPPGSKRKGMDA